MTIIPQVVIPSHKPLPKWSQCKCVVSYPTKTCLSHSFPKPNLLVIKVRGISCSERFPQEKPWVFHIFLSVWPPEAMGAISQPWRRRRWDLGLILKWYRNNGWVIITMNIRKSDTTYLMTPETAVALVISKIVDIRLIVACLLVVNVDW